MAESEEFGLRAALYRYETLDSAVHKVTCGGVIDVKKREIIYVKSCFFDVVKLKVFLH